MATHITETTTIHEDSVSVFSSPGANMIAGSPLRSGMAVGVQQGVQRGPTYGANLSSPMWASNRGGPAGGQMGMGMQMGMQSGMQSGMQMSYSQQTQGYSQQTQGYSQQQSSPNRGGGYMQAASAPVREAEDIKYIEIPVVQEVLKKIPKREIITIERKVPVVTYEYVDKVVEVPEIHYVDKVVEVPQSREVVVRVPIIEYVEVEREVIRTVPKINVTKVEKEVDVPGEIIEVEVPYTVENKIVVPKYEMCDVAAIVAQSLHPFVSQSDETIDVTVFEWEAIAKTVEIFLPRAVSRTMTACNIESIHKMVKVTAAQWNSLVFNANAHIRDENDLKDILVCEGEMVPTIQGKGTQLVHPVTVIDDLLAERTETEIFQVWVTEEAKQSALVDLAMRPVAAQQANRIMSNPDYPIPHPGQGGGATSVRGYNPGPMSYSPQRPMSTTYASVGGAHVSHMATARPLSSTVGGPSEGMSSPMHFTSSRGQGMTQRSFGGMGGYAMGPPSPHATYSAYPAVGTVESMPPQGVQRKLSVISTSRKN